MGKHKKAKINAKKTKLEKPSFKSTEEANLKSCPSCPKKFKNQSTLDTHISTQACINPCTLCNKNFTCKATRAIHLEKCIKEYLARRDWETKTINVAPNSILSFTQSDFNNPTLTTVENIKNLTLKHSQEGNLFNGTPGQSPSQYLNELKSVNKYEEGNSDKPDSLEHVYEIAEKDKSMLPLANRDDEKAELKSEMCETYNQKSIQDGQNVSNHIKAKDTSNQSEKKPIRRISVLKYRYYHEKDYVQGCYNKKENTKLAEKYPIIKMLNAELDEILLKGPTYEESVAKRQSQVMEQMSHERLKMGSFIDNHKDAKGKWNGISDRHYLDRLEPFYTHNSGVNVHELLLDLVKLCSNGKNSIEHDFLFLKKMHFDDLDPKEYPVQVTDNKRMNIKFKRPDNTWHIDNEAHILGTIFGKNMIKTLLVASKVLTHYIADRKKNEDDDEKLGALMDQYNIALIQYHMKELSEKKYQQKLMHRLIIFLSNSNEEVPKEAINKNESEISVKLTTSQAAQVLPFLLANNQSK